MDLLLIAIIGLSFLSAFAKGTKKIKSSKRSKTKKKYIQVIDATNEMEQAYNYLSKHYKEFSNYKELNQIEEEDKLKLLQYIWKRWEKHITKKSLKETFPKYDKNLLFDISIIESGRVYTYYKQKEFKKQEKSFEQKQLILISGDIYRFDLFYCTTDNMMEFYINSLEDRYEGEPMMDFLIMSSEFDFFKKNFPAEYINIWQKDKFIPMNQNDLKQYCKDNHIGYPFI